MNGDESPIRIWVHPDMAEELHIRKKIMEEKGNEKIYGGIPIVSKISALELKRNRERDKKNITVEIQKIKGTKKNEIISLW